MDKNIYICKGIFIMEQNIAYQHNAVFIYMNVKNRDSFRA